MTGALLGFAAGVFGAWAAAEIAGAVYGAARTRGPRFLRAVAALAAALAAAGREGRDPGATERRRMLAAGAGVALVVGLAVAGPLPAMALAGAGPWVVAKLLRARRDHYRRAVDAGAAELAVALADALAAGHSLRGAVGEAAAGVAGQAGHELRRTAAELAAGASTAEAFDALRLRTLSPRIVTVVTACLVQREAGGDLARLLRDSARTFGDQARLEDEVRAATAQARFTGLVVVLLPLAGAALAELASPGFVAGLLASWLTAWLVVLAVAMQIAAGVAIHRLGRVRW